MIKEGLNPVIDKKTKVIILGSFPSEISLKKDEYYANPRNQFWKLMSRVTDQDLEDFGYDKRLTVLLERKIGLWDIFSSCEREGSLDSRIKNAQLNNFEILKEYAPNLELVCFNGQKSGKYESILKGLGYKTLILPSSSPAHARSLVNKLTFGWNIIKQYI